MTNANFLMFLSIARWLNSQIPIWADSLRRKGELTAEGEAAYQAHQAEVYAKPSMQPEKPEPS